MKYGERSNTKACAWIVATVMPVFNPFVLFMSFVVKSTLLIAVVNPTVA